MSNVNVELLVKIKEHIKAHPDKFDMALFESRCGTQHCIGGLAIVLSGEKMPDLGFMDDTYDIQARAKTLLGLTSTTLFFVGLWPEDLMTEYYDTADSLHRRDLACIAIDRTIQYGSGMRAPFE